MTRILVLGALSIPVLYVFGTILMAIELRRLMRENAALREVCIEAMDKLATPINAPFNLLQRMTRALEMRKPLW